MSSACANIEGNQCAPVLSELGANAVESLQLTNRSVEIEVLAGSCWITLENDPNDYAVATGESVTFSGPGMLVVQGLSAVNVWSFRSIAG
jgi:hypothetical protein